MRTWNARPSLLVALSLTLACASDPSSSDPSDPGSSWEGLCGDGTLFDLEGCDDGNTDAGDGCSSTCTVEYGWTCVGAPSACTTTCGDGLVAGAETCDDGNVVTEGACPYGQATCTACNATCDAVLQLTGSLCGDGVVNADYEWCDDGNTVTETSCAYGEATCTKCSADCRNVLSLTGPYCGDGERNGNEVCDAAELPSSCTYSATQVCCSQCNTTCTGVSRVCEPRA